MDLFNRTPTPTIAQRASPFFRLSLLRLLFDTPGGLTHDQPVTNRELYHFAHVKCMISKYNFIREESFAIAKVVGFWN